jgi:hypothetical protein
VNLIQMAFIKDNVNMLVSSLLRTEQTKPVRPIIIRSMTLSSENDDVFLESGKLNFRILK